MNKKEFVQDFITTRKNLTKNSSHGTSDMLLKDLAESEYNRQKVTNKSLEPLYEKMFKEINEKFQYGDAINDTELALLLDFYRDLEFKLDLMGERFHFAWRDVHDKVKTLENFRKARLKKKN